MSNEPTTFIKELRELINKYKDEPIAKFVEGCMSTLNQFFVNSNTNKHDTDRTVD